MSLLHYEVEDAADVGGHDGAGGADFAPEKLLGLLLQREVGAERLEGDGHAELQVEGEPDLAHAAPSQEGAELVAVS